MALRNRSKILDTGQRDLEYYLSTLLMFVVGLALGAQHTRKVDLKGIRSHLGHNPVMALAMNGVNCLF